MHACTSCSSPLHLWCRAPFFETTMAQEHRRGVVPSRGAWNPAPPTRARSGTSLRRRGLPLGSRSRSRTPPAAQARTASSTLPVTSEAGHRPVRPVHLAPPPPLMEPTTRDDADYLRSWLLQRPVRDEHLLVLTLRLIDALSRYMRVVRYDAEYQCWIFSSEP